MSALFGIPTKHVAYTSALIGLGFLALGSSKAKPGDKTSDPVTTTSAMVIGGSCDAIKGISTCMDYATLEEAKTDCPSFDGKVSPTPCTAAGLSGSCAIDGKGVRRYYSTGAMPSTPDYAKAHCANAMAGTFTAAPAAGAAGTPAAAGAAPATGTGDPVIPEMTAFMGELAGTSKSVAGALKKHGSKGLKTQDMQMWNLESPAVTGSTKNGNQTCYTMTAASGMTTRTYGLCWAGGKIVSVTDEGMK